MTLEQDRAIRGDGYIDLYLAKSNNRDTLIAMDKVISIYEARTNLSKYIKKAQAGQTIYVGAYGTPQAVIAPLPTKRPIKIGVWAHKKKINYDDLIESDPEIAAWLESSDNDEIPPR